MALNIHVSCLIFLIASIFGSVSSNLTPDPGRLASSSFFVDRELSTELRVATIVVRFFFHLRDYKQQGVSLLARDKRPKSKKEVVMEVIQKSKHFKGNDSTTFSLTENENSDLDMISSEKAVQELYTRA